MPKTSMSEDLEPAYVGQYNFEKNIGQGTYGKVKLAIHSETGEKVPL
jgi:serine/threonine protein kinase